MDFCNWCKNKIVWGSQRLQIVEKGNICLLLYSVNKRKYQTLENITMSEVVLSIILQIIFYFFFE